MQQVNTVEQEVFELDDCLEKKEDSPVGENIKMFFLILGTVLSAILVMCMIFMKQTKPSQSMMKLEQVNKTLIYNTISLEDNNLQKLQNIIYKDLKKQNENINYVIANPDLLVLNFNTQEFHGGELKIGTNATIDISYENNKKIISYHNFTQEGRDIIIKQIDRHNYPKINMKNIENKNKDDTYNISVEIDSVQNIEKIYQ